jgi:hypothetical protein
LGKREKNERMEVKNPGLSTPRGVVQYTQGALPEGENGILLFVRQNGKVIGQKMVVSIEAD